MRSVRKARRAIDGPVMTVARTKTMSPREMVVLDRRVKRVETESALGDGQLG